MVDDATATSSCMGYFACGCGEEGDVGLLGGQFGSHVIKTNNILGGALAGRGGGREGAGGQGCLLDSSWK